MSARGDPNPLPHLLAFLCAAVAVFHAHLAFGRAPPTLDELALPLAVLGAGCLVSHAVGHRAPALLPSPHAEVLGMVLVGAAQLSQRAEDPGAAREPLLLMEDALRAAAEDAGAPGLLAQADSIRVPQGLWEYPNPARWLAERFGPGRVETALGLISGTTVQRTSRPSPPSSSAPTSLMPFR